MSEFDNWKEEQERIHNDYDAENAWYAGQQSQQAKIELLEKELTETQAFLNKQNHIKQVKINELQARVDDLTEINRLKTIALQQSVNRTSIHVHEKIVALESKLKGNKDEK